MSKIIEIKTAVVKFLKSNIRCHEITIIKLDKVDDDWEAIAEVYEDDSFLKSMNLPPKNTRLFYAVKMDQEKEVISFERLTEYFH
ncbi:MAG: hypothetical protein ACI9LN_004793 [Saprospiraceae bacterium]|jgi:hypothetical protein